MNNLHIVAYSDEPFLNRLGAAKLLVAEIKKIFSKGSSTIADSSKQNQENKKIVVLGIPRGGLVIAKEIANAFSAELDIVLSRKIGAPSNPEFAIGAVSENGRVFINEEVAGSVSASDEYVISEKKRQIAEIKRRIETYRKIKPKVNLENKIVIVCDDGIATGATMQASLWVVRQEEARKIIVAVPVAPYETLKKIAKESEEVICLRVPEFFTAVGQFYMDFPQIGDKEVLGLLE